MTHLDPDPSTVQHRELLVPYVSQLLLQRTDQFCALRRGCAIKQEANQVGEHARARNVELHVRSGLQQQEAPAAWR
jgi:hypothetical protein